MIVDKKQIIKICELTEEIEKNIQYDLTKDEMKFFEGFIVFNMKVSDYVAVNINKRGRIWVNGYSKNYDDFVNRDIQYIDNINNVSTRAQKAIEKAKNAYKKSLHEGEEGIRQLREINANLLSLEE